MFMVFTVDFRWEARVQNCLWFFPQLHQAAVCCSAECNDHRALGRGAVYQNTITFFTLSAHFYYFFTLSMITGRQLRLLIKPLLLSHSFYTLLSQLPTKMKANWQLILQQLNAQFVKRYPRTMEITGNYISIYNFDQSCLTPDGPPSQSGRKVKTRELINHWAMRVARSPKLDT